jgi:hypothetical protein
MRNLMLSAAVCASVLAFASGAKAQSGNDGPGFRFFPGTLVVSKSVYVGNAGTVIDGEDLPLGCPGGANGSTNVNVASATPGGAPISVAVPCGIASDNGQYPSVFTTHNVWNNSGTDGSFGITSPIFLDSLTTFGLPLGTFPIPSNLVVTSFSSKSELALNLSADGKSLTFMAYHGGPGCGGFPTSPTRPDLIDVSASNTPAVCDPTNPVITSFLGGPPTAYYRAVVEVGADGDIDVTDGNAYSGDNGRAAFKAANGLYYMVGNDNSGNIPKKNILTTASGVELANATGAELLVPGQTPPVPPNIAMIGRLNLISGDKVGKETNFRGLTIFNNTLYVSKGSGGNGINTVYQVGSTGTLPTGSATQLSTVPIAILPGFPNTAASTNTAFPFGMFFANATTLYVCDEGDGTLVTPPVNGNVADAQSLATAGLQKWSFVNGTWTMLYVLQDGLNIGVPYSVPFYPSSLNPATGGCRNITGHVNPDGTVDIYAITSTISANGDTGADPNMVVKVTDILDSQTVPAPSANPFPFFPFFGGTVGRFVTIEGPRAGVVYRGVAFAPSEGDGNF